VDLVQGSVDARDVEVQDILQELAKMLLMHPLEKMIIGGQKMHKSPQLNVKRSPQLKVKQSPKLCPLVLHVWLGKCLFFFIFVKLQYLLFPCFCQITIFIL